MAYFPEQIMPANIKDESQDVRGNPHVIGASDHNKIEEEIRAIELYLGVKPSSYSVGFSGQGCGLASFSAHSGYAYAPPVAASAVGSNNLDLLEYVSTTLNTLKDETIMVTSGVIAVADPIVPGADGMIPWPASWAPFMTTLSQDIDDTTVYDEQDIVDLESLGIADTTGLDEIGFVSIINNVYSFPLTVGGNADDYMAYGFSGTVLPSENGTGEQRDLLYRQLSMGSNVEVFSYWGLTDNTILRVGRKKQGTMSWVHKTGDLVFKGKLSIHVTPLMFMAPASEFNSVECYVTPAGRVHMRTRAYDSTTRIFSENSTKLYASYQAVLVRTPLLYPRAV
jgi:hypothetical protein